MSSASGACSTSRRPGSTSSPAASTASRAPRTSSGTRFDLAQTRFSGRSVTPPPDADSVTQEAYSAEVISFGFWAGDERIPEPSYYSYTAPEPADLTERPLAPDGAAWASGPTGSLALLPYDAVRTAADPTAALLEFLQSAYEAGADTAGWDRAELRPRRARRRRPRSARRRTRRGARRHPDRSGASGGARPARRRGRRSGARTPADRR